MDLCHSWIWHWYFKHSNLYPEITEKRMQKIWLCYVMCSAVQTNLLFIKKSQPKRCKLFLSFYKKTQSQIKKFFAQIIIYISNKLYPTFEFPGYPLWFWFYRILVLKECVALIANSRATIQRMEWEQKKKKEKKKKKKERKETKQSHKAKGKFTVKSQKKKERKEKKKTHYHTRHMVQRNFTAGVRFVVCFSLLVLCEPHFRRSFSFLFTHFSFPFAHPYHHCTMIADFPSLCIPTHW